MAEHESAQSTTTGGLAVAPSLQPTLDASGIAAAPAVIDARVVWLCGLAVVLGLLAGLVAQLLAALIALFTNLAFFGELSFASRSPADHALGPIVIVVPIVGAVIVGVMARYGSQAIRGHGIPEAMEQVLFHGSRIPARITFLKPLSAAVAIGTGGPFGAEGPIIATGGALGSLVGQLLRTTAEERKVLLAAGAGAGMSATFGAPVSAVLLAVELLLFEYRPRSVIPVALATSVAAAVRIAMIGGGPMFAMPDLAAPTSAALACYVAIGACAGVASVGVTRAVYAIEDAFTKLPIHWMWWPAIGAVVVGLVGWVAPHTLGVGYDNIDGMLDGELFGRTMIVLCLLKFVSWAIALGSGTSGGTLAPLFTFGAGLGAALATIAALVLPSAAIDPRVGALVGMAAIFAGASRALLASVVFAFEITRQPLGLLPLLAGCSASFLISALLMRHSIMTEKLARRGAVIPSEYAVDPFAQLLVRDHCVREVVTLAAGTCVSEARAWLASGVTGSTHQGFPVVDESGGLLGMITRRDLDRAPDDATLRTRIERATIAVRDDGTLREATDRMVIAEVGRLPVVDGSGRLRGIITRSDLLRARGKWLAEQRHSEQRVRW